MSHFDVLYTEDDDNYQVGDRVSCCLDAFDEQKRKLIPRPPGQVPRAERLRQGQGTSGPLLLTFRTAAIAGEHL
ncbi:hypothetical protein [Streptomyces hokutonensis]|uniref:hypothetical protein n=1 Tax=Streptomyces hokutonensis TaxID=1306990 RepID=UPI0036B2F1CA